MAQGAEEGGGLQQRADLMVLDAATLARSIVTPGSAAAWAPVFSRLDAGEPIVVGVFGASVAQVSE